MATQASIPVTQAVPAQRDIPLGTPVEISPKIAPEVRRQGNIFTEAKYALFTGYQANIDPTKTYINLLVHDKDVSFRQVTVSVPIDNIGLAVAKPTRAKMLDKLYKAYTKANIATVLVSMPHGVLGSDPEIFVRDRNTGEIIPSWLFLKSKEELEIPGIGHYKEFWDGFQGEFTVEQSYCNDLFVNHLRYGLSRMYTQVKAYSPDAVLSMDSVVEVPQKYLREADDKHVMFGCMPSKNVYGASGEHAGSGRNLPIRFAGGHIHFSKYPQDEETVKNTVKALDAILGVLSVPIFKAFDNPVRRKFYGLAGEYRTPSYGMEYRTLSNAWLCHPGIAHLVLDLARTSAKFANAKLNSTIIGSEQLIQDIINTGDVSAAHKYIKKNKDLFSMLFKFTYRGWGSRVDSIHDTIFRLIAEGAESLLESPKDVERNWMLASTPSWSAASDGGRVRWSSASLKIAEGNKV